MICMKRLSLSIVFLLITLIGYAQYTQLTNLPTIYVDTYNNRAITSKTAYIYATLTYVDGTKIVQYDSLQIRGRGNSTWNLAKKPYRIKFNESTKFLGKGFAKNKSWTLLANHADKSLLRNAVTFTLGDYLGQDFSPAAHFVDLVLNGTYLGNYQVSDQVNVDNKRVEVYEQEEVATDTSNITGGYLVEIDGFGTSEPVYFRTGKNLIVSVKSPDEDIINTAQRNYIAQYFNSFENALFGNDFEDAVRGYRPLVDSLSLISWYIATELSANVDGFWSTYVYKDRDDPKLYFGPLWDYDIAYNNCNRVGDMTRSSMIDEGFGSDLTKVWMKRMIQDPWFNKAVNDVWKQKQNEGLEQYLYNYIDSMAAYLDASQTKNYARYSISSKVYNEIYLYSTYADYIDQLKTFISQHMDFLTELFAKRVGDDDAGDDDTGDDEETILQPFELSNGYYYRIYNKSTNKVLDVADGTEVVIWSPEYGRNTQLWEIKQIGEHFQLINRETGMAFNDPSPTKDVGTPLDVAIPDEKDARQLWQFVTVNENDNYNIINVYTNHAINNSGGASADGNNVLSYTNDARNSVSNNRQWRIVPEEMIPDYIPEEVKEELATTIEEAETFLSGLIPEEIGNDIFQYQIEAVDVLRQMVADAKMFESTVQDDYILANVNLAKQLDNTRKMILPSVSQQYVICHKSSGYYLNILPNKLSVLSEDKKSEAQHFTFEATGSGNGVFLKSADGLYVMLGTTNSWTMLGQEYINDERRATFNVSRQEDCYRIYTMNGLLGTDAITENSTVYANKREGYPDEEVRSEWLILEWKDEATEALKNKLAELAQVISEAKAYMESIPSDWVGEEPLQISGQSYEDACEIISEAEMGEYATVDMCEDMIFRISEVMADVAILNTPLANSDYYLEHASGLFLSVNEGVIVAAPDTLDSAQRFRLIEVSGSPNTYYIYSNGMYVSVLDDEGAMLALTETPRGDWGKFVVNKTGSKEFTLKTVAGYFGLDGLIAEDGVACVANAPNNGSNICWRLLLAGNSISDDNTNIDYSYSVDYAVKYDRNREVICFVSDDMEALKNVNVSLYTVGARLLYSFTADKEQPLTELPSGTYIVHWVYEGKSHSAKLKK